MTILARARKVEKALWSYEPSTGRYRDEDGRLVSDARLRNALDAFLLAQRERTRSATADLAAGYSTVPEWEVAMRRIVKDAHGGAYMLGRGGRNAMTQSDWGRVGQMVRKQYQYLNGYARDVADGKVSAEQAMTRSALYIGAARAAHSTAMGKGSGWPTLPAQPGDGSTICLGHCRCWWSVAKISDGGWEATWNATSDPRECDDCDKRAKDWAPLALSA